MATIAASVETRVLVLRCKISAQSFPTYPSGLILHTLLNGMAMVLPANVPRSDFGVSPDLMVVLC